MKVSFDMNRPEGIVAKLSVPILSLVGMSNLDFPKGKRTY